VPHASGEWPRQFGRVSEFAHIPYREFRDKYVRIAPGAPEEIKIAAKLAKKVRAPTTQRWLRPPKTVLARRDPLHLGLAPLQGRT
jgi:hypothetical protein